VDRGPPPGGTKDVGVIIGVITGVATGCNSTTTTIIIITGGQSKVRLFSLSIDEIVLVVQSY
jgi:hypothetical protein